MFQRTIFFLVFTFTTLFYFVPNTRAQQSHINYGIGVALSGGGAKGMAHIGILKAIDSAGLPISVITGTSMGSIIGGLYAAGYSASQIETMFRKANWDELLSNISPYTLLSIEAKEEYGKYDVELALKKGKIQLPQGALEAQSLWTKLGEYFLPVYEVKNFLKLPIAFGCIATDLETGFPVLLDSGELTYAIRASMAIPSVFTPVTYNKKKLVDGGLSVNFPVIDAKKMGARLVIGSNVAEPLLPKEKLNDVLAILGQVAFFQEARDTRKQGQFSDIYIEHNTKNYGSSNFSSINAIIDSGIKKGREYYPIFKRMADSLTAIYGTLQLRDSIRTATKVQIGSYAIHGLNTDRSKKFFLEKFRYKANKTYTATDLANGLKYVYSTEFYDRVVYSLKPQSDGKVKIIFDVADRQATYLKASVAYDVFNDISVIGNITTHNLLLSNSRDLFSISIGSNTRLHAAHLQYLGYKKNIGLDASVTWNMTNRYTYNDNLLQIGSSSQNYVAPNLSINLYGINQMIAAGTKAEYFYVSPTTNGAYDLKGYNLHLYSYGAIETNTLNRRIYPTSGTKIALSGGLVYAQNVQFKYLSYGQATDSLPQLQTTAHIPFVRVMFNINSFLPILRKLTVSYGAQLNINFKGANGSIPVNPFYIGGTGVRTTFPNQITFVGLKEGMVATNSIAIGRVGVQLQIKNPYLEKLYFITKANIGLYNLDNINYLTLPYIPLEQHLLYGAYMCLATNTIIGPVEIGGMYGGSTQTSVLQFRIAVGLPL